MYSTVFLCTLFYLLPYAFGAPVESPFVGTLISPTANSVLTPGESFPFAYQTRNWCEQDYTKFRVSLVQSSDAPTFNDVSSADGIVEGAVWDFGTFTISNFPGIPVEGVPPPTTLTFPNELQATNNTPLYLTVSDIYLSCPGHVVEEIGVTSIPIIYSAST
ncbi:hypothetical protein K474DRAFT_1773880 [Panus rudis PR-1116 ss-1]|nr:hypothetical protein K474DRAFT_1773880 [Panus rudis PR-1116 ss-1]